MSIRTKPPSAPSTDKTKAKKAGSDPTKKRKGKAKATHTEPKLRVLKIEQAPASTLAPNDYNPNWQDHHEFELLLRSMKDDGFTTPIIVQEQSREIIDGEHRWTAAIVSAYLTLKHPLGKDEFWPQKLIADARERRSDLLSEVDPVIPIVLTDMTPEQMRVATLRHNRARGEEDVELAAEVLKDLQDLGALDWAAEELMLDDETLKRLMEDVAASEALADEEFAEAWDPSDTGDEGGEDGVGGTQADSTDTGTRANSEGASRLRRERLERLREAKTEEERQIAVEETKIFRLNLVFSGAEAETITAVLGDTPAVRLLELCSEALASQGPSVDTGGKSKRKPKASAKATDPSEEEE